MRKIAILLMLVISSISCANELSDLGEQMSFFYLNSSEANFQELQSSANKFEDQFKSSTNSAELIIAVMTAKISEKYNWPIQDSFFSDVAREIIAGKTDLAKFVNNDEMVDPTKLDIWWVSYFATGEEEYLAKIFHYAGEELPQGNIEKLMVIGAATWSFNSNCQQHQSVKAFVARMSDHKGLSESKRKFLNKCIEFGWKNPDGTPVLNTDAMKSIRGFGGWLVITSDLDWEEKWNTPSETTPHFTEASEVNYGEQLTILTFFGNPSVSDDGAIEIQCDIQIERPDGSYAIDAKDVECAKGPLQGHPNNVRLTQTIINYVGEPDDPLGEWKVAVTLKDKLKGVDIPLRTKFVLMAGGAKTAQ